MKNPIRRQLLTPLLAVLVTAVAGTAGFSAWVSSARQVSMLEERRDEVARVLEQAPFPVSQQVLEQIARLSGQQLVVWDPKARRILLSSFASAPGRLAAEIEKWAGGEDRAKELALAGERYDIRAIRVRSRPGMQMLVLTPQRSLREARWSALWPPLAVGAAALLVLVPWLLALTAGWSRRVERIQQAVAKIARGEAPPAPQSGAAPELFARDDELSALVNDIHQMSGQLDKLRSELVQAERERLAAQLAAGFAHQFRNGVAGASLALQLHAGRCASADKSLAVAQKQLALVETEIRGMLSLGKRAESPREIVSLRELIAEAVELVTPMAEHHSIRLVQDVENESLRVQGSRDGLRAALVNLLLNAIDAAGPAGSVRVAARSEAAHAIVSIEDNGPGPAPEIAARMTEAFATTKPEGIGLGLTVVATVAADHGGRLSWKRRGEWTAFELTLPLHQPEA
jgi:signal transduction histidine kinase